jgi:hypothetical protein
VIVSITISCRVFPSRHCSVRNALPKGGMREACDRETEKSSRRHREAARSGTSRTLRKRGEGAEASGLERGARAGISPTNSKPLVLATSKGKSKE